MSASLMGAVVLPNIWTSCPRGFLLRKPSDASPNNGCKLTYSSHSNDHYKTLGVDPGATKEEIKDAYYTLSKRFHPDSALAADPARFHAINEAYQVLANEAKRANYDMEAFKQAHNSHSSASGHSWTYPPPPPVHPFRREHHWTHPKRPQRSQAEKDVHRRWREDQINKRKMEEQRRKRENHTWWGRDAQEKYHVYESWFLRKTSFFDRFSRRQSQQERRRPPNEWEMNYDNLSRRPTNDEMAKKQLLFFTFVPSFFIWLVVCLAIMADSNDDYVRIDHTEKKKPKSS